MTSVQLYQIIAISLVSALVALFLIRINKYLNKDIESKAIALIDSNMQLEEANKQLLAHDKIQMEIINIASHELRTPVQPLLGIAEKLEEGLDSGVKEIKIARPDIEILARNANRLAKLTSDILEVSRIESNSMKLKKENIDLKEKIERVIADTKPFIDEGAELEIVLEAAAQGAVIVEADRSKLFEVLSNLVRNAIKFTKQGLITIRLERTEDYAVISVKDTGQGIDPDIFPKLFTKFATKADAGTGLGLYISKSIVEAHGGRIWAENNPDRRGSTFTFTLPLKDDRKRTSRS